MRSLFTLIICCLITLPLQGTDSLFTYVISQDIESYIIIKDHIPLLLDNGEDIHINDLISGNHPPFAHPNQQELPKDVVTAWSGFRLSNQLEKPVSGYLNYSVYLDSLIVYEVAGEDAVEIAKISSDRLPKDDVFIWRNAFPFYLAPGETKAFFTKAVISYPKNIKVNNLKLKHISNSKHLVKYQNSTFAMQFFYLGMMLFFALVSLLMFALFREKAFLYFPLLMISLVAYFFGLTGIFARIFNFTSGDAIYSLVWIPIPIAGILFTTFLFINAYVDLKRKMPTYFKYYQLFTFFTVFIEISSAFLASILLNHLINLLVLIFIFVTFYPLTLLLRKGDKAARTVLVSLAILVVFSVIHTISSSLFLAPPKLSQMAFQIGTLFFSGILFYGLFHKVNAIRLEKQKIQALDELKSRFFTNISHEFRTPLTLVMGPVQEAANSHPDPVVQNRLRVAYQNGERLLQLINQLLDLAKLESGKMKLEAREQNFYALLKGIVMSFESLAVRKNIRLHFGCKNEVVPLFVDTRKVEKIFFNLLSNAFKFTQENGEITVLVSEEKDTVEIIVRDTGIGIMPDRLPFIFDRFFQADPVNIQEQEGTGIGLALVKELVELHEGTIKVKSKPQKGTTFSIQFLKGKKHLKESDLLSITEDPEVGAPLSERESTRLMVSFERTQIDKPPRQKTPFSDLPIVLIIEDNTDLRAYIRNHLESVSQVLEAKNGEEGIQKAFEHLPDLVISDVMMPQRDGYEVCQTLKTDQRTSHIPVLLLTAKASQKEKLQGLETGADDYITKPFDSDELRIRVQNLIKTREIMRQQFAKGEVTKVGANEVDRQFYEKTIALINEHLTDEQFSVEKLAEAIGMSRVQLNRKLKAITDLSASKMIQSVRLQKAKEMLLQKAGNVSDIAFATGFNSVPYFVKCYRERFGETPGDVLKT